MTLNQSICSASEEDPIPKLCRHKAIDRAYARVDGRHVYFGK